eukprot:3385962-Prymnesium_polylepis.2
MFNLACKCVKVLALKTITRNAPPPFALSASYTPRVHGRLSPPRTLPTRMSGKSHLRHNASDELRAVARDLDVEILAHVLQRVLAPDVAFCSAQDL